MMESYKLRLEALGRRNTCAAAAVVDTLESRVFLAAAPLAAIVAAPTPASTITVTATADAFVSDGASANQNYGAATILAVRHTPGVGLQRIAYLTFDLGTATTLSSAKLRIFGGSTATAKMSVGVYAVPDTTWDEKTVTYNKRPGPGALQGGIALSGASSGWHEVDLSTYAKSQLGAGHHTLSIALVDFGNSSGYAFFNSREAATHKPQLVVTSGTVSPTPMPTVSSISWALGPASPIGRVEAGASQVGSKLYIFGGYVGLNFGVSNTADVLDMATGKWSTIASPGAQSHSGFASDGVRYIYKAGGQVGAGIPGVATSDVYRFDSITGAWLPLPSLPEARYGGDMQLLNGKLYFFGGDKPDRTTVTTNLWVLDLANPSLGWVAKKSMPAAGDHLSGAVVDGKIYAIGGQHGHGNKLPDNGSYIQHSYFFSYDPATDKWTILAKLPQARSHAERTTLVINHKIVVLGGLSAKDISSRQVDVYDPATKKWTTLNNIPLPDAGGAAGYYNGKIYLADGQGSKPSWTIWRSTWIGTPVNL